MTDKTLSKARGLNSIADPRSFKGSSGRRRATEADQPAPTSQPAPPPPAIDRVDSAPPPAAPPRAAPVAQPPIAPVEAPALAEPIPQALRSDQHDERGPSPAVQAPPPIPAQVPADPRAPHRAVSPGINRKRRELSVPHVLADALERTGINPADVVMAGYRKHSHAIYAGEGGRMTAKGRTRLRLSISDTEFEQLTRLGQARGWNRSETVSVILAMELLGPTSSHPVVGGHPS